VLWLIDAQNPHDPPAAAMPVWMVRNKVDLDAPDCGDAATQRPVKSRTDFGISARRGDGIAQLIAALVGFAETFFGSGEGGLITRTRQRQLLQDAADSLQRSLVHQGEELTAEELRAAAYSLGRLLGRVDVEDILDVIFREFCVGK
jgi:tRNA modification GTPase